MNQWKIKNVPVHSKLKEKPKKFFFFFWANNLHIPKELGRNIFFNRNGLEGPLFLASQVRLKCPNFLTRRIGLEAFEQYFCKAYYTKCGYKPIISCLINWVQSKIKFGSSWLHSIKAQTPSATGNGLQEVRASLKKAFWAIQLVKPMF